MTSTLTEPNSIEILADGQQTPCFSSKREPTVLADIYQEDINIAIWQRQFDQPLVDATNQFITCLLYTSPSPRDRQKSRMPSSA